MLQKKNRNKKNAGGLIKDFKQPLFSNQNNQFNCLNNLF